MLRTEIDPVIRDFLMAQSLVSDDGFEAEPLTGGVASDIWLVRDDARCFVVKKALAQLRVRQAWHAPVSRNASEVAWMIEAGRVVPGAVPSVLAHDTHAGTFAMDYLDPTTHPVWKAELMGGRVDPDFAARLGATIGRIHAATAGQAHIAAAFDHDATFHALRLEPYLEATARVHTDLAAPLAALVRQVAETKHALVHGDVSPKNILVGPDGPVVLDAECAWYGDPSFDLAFCLNHLLLKAVHLPAHASALLAAFETMTRAYLAEVNWEPPAEIEARTAALLPALTLARVDGKSPVEYLTDDAVQQRVRDATRPHIAAPATTLGAVKTHWETKVINDG